MRRFCIGIAAACMGMALLGTAAFAGNMVIKGSTTVLPIAQRAAEKFMEAHPDVVITISGGGSSNGIKALLDGTTDIANASRPMKESEISLAKEKGINPLEHRVAMDAVAVMVHPSNPVRDLTLEQLRDIYSGKITNWQEVGGESKAIAVVGRDTSSGTFETWETLVMNKEKVTPRALVVASAGALLQTVSKNPLAIGYDGLGYVNDSVKVVPVGGIEPTAESAVSGIYPIARYLFMYTDGEPKGDTKAFLDFLLSPQGQSEVEAAGFIPVK